MIAKTLYGLEDLLAKELQELGASAIEKGIRNVSFEGDTGFMYKANLQMRFFSLNRHHQLFQRRQTGAFNHQTT